MIDILAQTDLPEWAFEIFKGSGPWAAVALILGNTILKAWKDDRQRLDAMAPSLKGIQNTVQEMQATNSRTVAILERIERRLDEVEKAHG